MITSVRPTAVDVLRRYRRLASHLICESLGYFSPEAAANAIAAHKAGRPFWCEWYMHLAGGQPERGEQAMLAVGRETLRAAFRYRGTHRGFMASYAQARRLVDEAIRSGTGPAFASWM